MRALSLVPGSFLILGSSGENLPVLASVQPFGVFLTSAFRTCTQEDRKNFLNSLRRAIPGVWVVSDNEGGYASWVLPGFPSPHKLATLPPSQAWDVLLHMTRKLARDLDGNFAPVVDRCVVGDPVITEKERCFSDNLHTVMLYAWMTIEAHRRVGLKAVAKHFLAQSLGRGDPHTGISVVNLPMEDLHPDLEIYRGLVRFGLPSVMVGHMVIPAGDSLPVGQSSFWIQKVLREDLGFGGVVITDDLAMEGAGDLETAVERAFFAGVDLFLVVWDEGRFQRIQSVLGEILRTRAGLREGQSKLQRMFRFRF